MTSMMPKNIIAQEKAALTQDSEIKMNIGLTQPHRNDVHNITAVPEALMDMDRNNNLFQFSFVHPVHPAGSFPPQLANPYLLNQYPILQLGLPAVSHVSPLDNLLSRRPQFYNNNIHGYTSVPQRVSVNEHAGQQDTLKRNFHRLKRKNDYRPQNRSPRTIDWNERLKMLAEYKKEHGHCMVPQSHPDLGAWVKWQREKYALYEKGKTSYFTKEKIDSLNNLGFVWRVRRKRKKMVEKREADNASQSSEKKEIDFLSIQKPKRQKSIFKSHDEKNDPNCTKRLLQEIKSHEDTEKSLPSTIIQHAAHTSVRDSQANKNTKESFAIAPSTLQQKVNLCQKVETKRSSDTFEPKKEIEKEMICKFCDGIYVKYTVCSPCGHSFCKSCVDAMRKTQSKRCLCCQTIVNETVPTQDVDNIILNMVKSGYFNDEAVSHYLKRKWLEENFTP